MSEEPAKKKFYQKWWFWLIVVIIVIAAISAAAGSGDGDTSDNVESNTTQTEEDEKYYIGDTVTSGDTRVKVTDVYETNKIGFDTTEYVFLVVVARVENIGSDEHIYSSSDFLLKNGNLEYQVHSAGLYLEDGFWLTLSLGPGIAYTVSFVYEIPRSYVYGNYCFEVDEGLLAPAQKIYLTSTDQNA